MMNHEYARRIVGQHLIDQESLDKLLTRMPPRQWVGMGNAPPRLEGARPALTNQAERAA